MNSFSSGIGESSKKWIYLLFYLSIFIFSLWQTFVAPEDIAPRTGVLVEEPAYISYSIRLKVANLGDENLPDLEPHPFVFTEIIKEENYWSFERKKFRNEVHKGDTITVLRSEKISSSAYGDVVGIIKDGHNYGNLFWRNVLAPWGGYLVMLYMGVCVGVGVVIHYLNRKHILREEYTFSLGNREYIISHLPVQAVACMMVLGILACFVWWMIDLKAHS